MRRRDFLGGLACLSAISPARTAGLRLDQLTSSTASLSGMTVEQSLRKIRELGFGGVEILTFAGQRHSVGPIPGVVVADLSKQAKDHLLSEVKRLQHVSTHLPFHGLRLANQDRAARKTTLDLLHRAIDDSGFWGARVATVHAAPEPTMTYEQIWPDLLAVFRELGDHAAKYKIRLAIETGSPNTVKQYLALIREIGHDFVGGCVDTGHTRAYRGDIGVDDSERATAKGAKRYNDILMQKVEGLGPKLFHFHFDDVRRADWREHRTLGTGLVDWDRLLRYLAQVGYAGTFAVELEETPPVDELVKSRLFYQKVLREIS